MLQVTFRFSHAKSNKMKYWRVLCLEPRWFKNAANDYYNIVYLYMGVYLVYIMRLSVGMFNLLSYIPTLGGFNLIIYSLLVGYNLDEVRYLIVKWQRFNVFFFFFFYWFQLLGYQFIQIGTEHPSSFSGLKSLTYILLLYTALI